MRRKVSFHFYALLTVTLWSSSYVFTRMALKSFSPFSLGFLRYACASVFLVAALLLTRAGRPPRKALGLLVLSGAVGFFLYMIFFNLGSQTVASATSCTVISTAPVLTALMARVFQREKLSPLQCVAIGVSFVGVVVLMILDLRLSAGPGLFYILTAAVLLSCYNLLQRKLTKICPPLVTTAYGIFFGTLMLCVFAPAAARELPSAPPSALACVAVLGVFCGAVAYCSWTRAFSLAKNASDVSNYMFVEPFLTAALGLALAGERLRAPTVIGGTLILCGLFLFYFGPRLQRRHA